MRLIRQTAAIALVGVIALAPIAPAVAQTQPTAATTTSAAVEKLEATITGVQGLVQVRQNENQPWAKATLGMTVGESAEFRTGPKSAVRFEIPPDQTITLDSPWHGQAARSGQRSWQAEDQPWHEVRPHALDIEAAGREHDASISSPSSTLAIRGTKVSLYDQRPFRAEAVSLTGRAEFRTGKKQLRFGGTNQGKTKVNVDEPSAAALALDQATLDPTISLARSASEAPLIQNLLSSAAPCSSTATSASRLSPAAGCRTMPSSSRLFPACSTSSPAGTPTQT
jgi:hypothetical protein